MAGAPLTRRLCHLGRANDAGDVVPVDGDRAAGLIEHGTLGHGRHRFVIIKRQPVVGSLPRDRSVHGTGVDVQIAQARSERAGQGALTGARGPINRDDEALHKGSVYHSGVLHSRRRKAATLSRGIDGFLLASPMAINPAQSSPTSRRGLGRCIAHHLRR